MDKEAFLVYMKENKKPPNTIKSYLNSLEFYVGYLRSQRQINSPEEAGPDDIKEFVAWGTAKGENVYRHFWGIKLYYHFKKLYKLEMTAWEWMEYVQNETRKLREFPQVDRDSVNKLSATGIKTVNQLLEAGNTPEKLIALAEKSGASQPAVLELFKLSQLSRLPGLKKIRGRLFYEAGLDTLEVIAALEPDEVNGKLSAYIDKSGFEGSVPTKGEVEITVEMARFLLDH
jgi:hypothetical protein